MRPFIGESKEHFMDRFLGNNKHFSSAQEREAEMGKMWEQGPDRGRTVLDDAVDACCSLGKVDLPSVEAAMFVIEPVVAVIWGQMLDRASESVSNAQRDELGPEWIMFVANELWRALAAVPQAQIVTLQDAAASLGSARRSYTAAQDMLLLLRGKFQLRWSDILPILEKRETYLQTRSQIRYSLNSVFGEPRTWVGVLVSTWAYRWKWVGEVLSRPKSKSLEFRYWNPLDSGTTPFCAWLATSGKTVTAEAILKQVNGIEEAIVYNDVNKLMKAWPMLTFTGRETEADFSSMLARNNVGAPPFHWGCRTRLLPL